MAMSKKIIYGTAVFALPGVIQLQLHGSAL